MIEYLEIACVAKNVCFKCLAHLTSTPVFAFLFFSIKYTLKEFTTRAAPFCL